MAEALTNPPATAAHLQVALQSRSSLASAGFHTPDWGSFLQGLRPRQPELDELDPGVPSHGWQFFAALSVEHHFRSRSVWPRLSPTEQALLRSQSGPMAELPFSAFPTSSLSRFPPQLFRVLLLRRLWFPLPLASCTCRCGRPLDVRGHHRAACSRAGVLGSRGFSVESAAARVCREAGARVSVNVFVRDLDLPVAKQDGRLWRMGFLFSEALNSPSTRFSFLQSVPMDSRGVDVTSRTELLSLKPVSGNSGAIRSCQELMGERVWWFSLPMWEAGGRKRLSRS